MKKCGKIFNTSAPIHFYLLLITLLDFHKIKHASPNFTGIRIVLRRGKQVAKRDKDLRRLYEGLRLFGKTLKPYSPPRQCFSPA